MLSEIFIYFIPVFISMLKFKNKHTKQNKVIWDHSFSTQGRIQGSSSYANDEVLFPSYEMLKWLKSV